MGNCEEVIIGRLKILSKLEQFCISHGTKIAEQKGQMVLKSAKNSSTYQIQKFSKGYFVFIFSHVRTYEDQLNHILSTIFKDTHSTISVL